MLTGKCRLLGYDPHTSKSSWCLITFKKNFLSTQTLQREYDLCLPICTHRSQNHESRLNNCSYSSPGHLRPDWIFCEARSDRISHQFRLHFITDLFIFLSFSVRSLCDGGKNCKQSSSSVNGPQGGKLKNLLEIVL